MFQVRNVLRASEEYGMPRLRSICQAAIEGEGRALQLHPEDILQTGYVFLVHVGGTRCVTSSTDNIMKIRARITWTVEFIRGYILIF